ncbi:HlyD family secretion protein [Acetobacter fabarum]|uniref:HlyD family secretion protein n=1 Tax=Acetobacter fabarum TaxID=483199 RepID=UPI00242A5E6F|nr:HlyD family secretion protein [Acetobacter fabarum]MCH4024720.1 HlyD family secretion protein [Acetobacter fabarum]
MPGIRDTHFVRLLPFRLMKLIMPAGWGRIMALGLILVASGAILTTRMLLHGDAITTCLRCESTDDAFVHADTVVLSAHVAGYITQAPVADNARVSIGQTLIAIRDDDYRARLAEKEATFREAGAALEVVQRQIVLETSQVAAAAATLRMAEADVTQRRLERRRQHDLITDGSTSHRDLEVADADLARLTAARDRDAALLDAARRMQDVLQARLGQAREAVEATRASRDLATIDLGYTRITSPVSGQVTARMVYPGEYVGIGTQVARVAPLPDVWIVANFREVQLTHMQVGQTTSIAIDAFPGRILRGHVDSIGPVSGAETALLPPDNATGNFTHIVQRFPVKIVLEPGQESVRLLRPGMSSLVSVQTDAGGDR